MRESLLNKAPIAPYENRPKRQTPMRNRTKSKKKSGFTLIELALVVTIIALVGAIALPTFVKIRRNAVITAFANDLKKLSNAGTMFILETGFYPPDTSSGVFDSELEGYISKGFFETETSMGGKWDFEWDDLGGVLSAVGVSTPRMSDKDFELVDKAIDDGDLSNGEFQKLAGGRYYFIIEE